MIDELVSKLGGREVVAARLGITPNAVYKWSAGDEPGIPSKHWVALCDMSKGDVTLEHIASLNAKVTA